jgi:hypothetical protein
MLIVYLPFVLGCTGDTATGEPHCLAHVLSAKEARRVAATAARGISHFGFDKVQYLGCRLGEHVNAFIAACFCALCQLFPFLFWASLRWISTCGVGRAMVWSRRALRPSRCRRHQPAECHQALC